MLITSHLKATCLPIVSVLINVLLIVAMLIITIIYTKIIIYYNQVQLDISNLGRIKSNTTSRIMLFRVIIFNICNVVCWMPMVVISLLSLDGITIYLSVFTVLISILMPINTISNPFIFTLTTTSFIEKLNKK